MVTKVISGFQTGADRAGVHAAYGAGVATGGWIPRDRRAQDGQISMSDVLKYGLQVHAGNGYPPRTEQNTKDSDGTVLFGNMDSPGCRLTIKCCRLHKKPYHIISSIMLRDLSIKQNVDGLIRFLNTGHIIDSITDDIRVKTMNVAGNREESNPGIYNLTFSIISDVLKELA